METIEKYEAKKKAYITEQERLAADLEQRKAELAAIEADILKAVDSDDYTKVEQLTRKKYDIQIRIESAETILKRKGENGWFNRDEVREAWESDLKKIQKTIAEKETQVRQQLVKAAAMAIDLADTINQSWKMRERYLTLIDDGEPWSWNVLNKDFPSASCPGPLMDIFKQDKFSEFVKVSAQDGKARIISATESRNNIFYGRDEGRDNHLANVTIFK